jgi:hypothetical protein
MIVDTVSADRAIAAMDCDEMPRSRQYRDRSQTSRDLVPLLALQRIQQSAMFSRVTIAALRALQREAGRHTLAGGTRASQT